MQSVEILLVILVIGGLVDLFGTFGVSIMMFGYDGDLSNIYELLLFPIFRMTKDETTWAGKVGTIILDLLLYPGYLLFFVFGCVVILGSLIFVKHRR